MANTASSIARAIEHEVAEAIGELTEAELKTIGDAAVDVIVLRTKQGVDADHKPFVPYSDSYKKTRERLSRSTTTVDLAVTGHMQQAITTEPGADSVTLGFLNPNEEKKAAIHNSGVDKIVSVRSHTRNAYIDSKTGKRVSRKEAALDKKRKNKRVAVRTESVDVFERHQKTPKREWFDIRHDVDVDIVAAAVRDVLDSRIK